MMSKCPKCDGSRFEAVEAKNIDGINYKMMFIQCAVCGTVVGATDYLHVPTMLRAIGEKLGVRFP